MRPGEKTVVIRPGISKQPEAGDHAVPIEKALVDLIAESSRLQLMDPAETQRILDTVLRAGLIQLPVMLAYAARRGVAIDSPEIAS